MKNPDDIYDSEILFLSSLEEKDSDLIAMHPLTTEFIPNFNYSGTLENYDAGIKFPPTSLNNPYFGSIAVPNSFKRIIDFIIPCIAVFGALLNLVNILIIICQKFPLFVRMKKKKKYIHFDQNQRKVCPSPNLASNNIVPIPYSTKNNLRQILLKNGENHSLTEKHLNVSKNIKLFKENLAGDQDSETISASKKSVKQADIGENKDIPLHKPTEKFSRQKNNNCSSTFLVITLIYSDFFTDMTIFIEYIYALPELYDSDSAKDILLVSILYLQFGQFSNKTYSTSNKSAPNEISEGQIADENSIINNYENSNLSNQFENYPIKENEMYCFRAILYIFRIISHVYSMICIIILIIDLCFAVTMPLKHKLLFSTRKVKWILCYNLILSFLIGISSFICPFTYAKIFCEAENAKL